MNKDDIKAMVERIANMTEEDIDEVAEMVDTIDFILQLFQSDNDLKFYDQQLRDIQAHIVRGIMFLVSHGLGETLNKDPLPVLCSEDDDMAALWDGDFLGIAIDKVRGHWITKYVSPHSMSVVYSEEIKNETPLEIMRRVGITALGVKEMIDAKEGIEKETVH